MLRNPPDEVQRLTARSPFPRGEDGRPLVPDDLLERVRAVTNEEAWSVLDRQHGYRFQFSGGWFQLHPDVVLAGRASRRRSSPRGRTSTRPCRRRAATRRVPESTTRG